MPTDQAPEGLTAAPQTSEHGAADSAGKLNELRRINRDLFTRLLASDLGQLPRSGAAAGATLRQAESAREAAEETTRVQRQQIDELGLWCTAKEAMLKVDRESVAERELELARLRTLEQYVNGSISMRLARLLRLPTGSAGKGGA